MEETMKGYKRHVEYRFTAGPWGTEFAILAVTDEGKTAIIEETRKNGQEDCHMYAEAHRQPDGTWKLEANSMIHEQLGERAVVAIEAHLNTYGMPRGDDDGAEQR
jgi:hypothetical protein